MKNESFNPQAIIPTDISFLDKNNSDNFFYVRATNTNDEFGIKDGDLILCIFKREKDGDLVIDVKVSSKEFKVYQIMKIKKKKDYVYLENSSSTKIMTNDYKPFGVVYKVFNQ